MAFSDREREFVRAARVGRLATVAGDGTPHAIPVCFALVGDAVVSPLDEKPKSVGPTELRRVRNVRQNPAATLIVDRYSEDWDELGWVQVRGRGSLLVPDDEGHDAAVRALRGKYDQYADQAIDRRPMLHVDPRRVVSWGDLSLRGVR